MPFLISIVLMLSLHAASAVRQNGPKPLVLTDCQPERIPGPAKCGTFEVYENRATKKGRKISLNIVCLPGNRRQTRTRPSLVYFAGGPGSAATEDAIGFAPEFAKIREHRDLLFVDQRGTGRSHPLNCEFLQP